MKNNIAYKLGISLFLLLSASNSYAGIDWSRYDEGPELFFGWETSFYFALGAIVLFFVSMFLTETFKGKNGSIEGGMGCFVIIVNIALVICILLSFYFIIPLSLLLYWFQKNRDKK